MGRRILALIPLVLAACSAPPDPPEIRDGVQVIWVVETEGCLSCNTRVSSRTITARLRMWPTDFRTSLRRCTIAGAHTPRWAACRPRSTTGATRRHGSGSGARS